MPKTYYEREELISDAKKAIGKKISELDKYGRLVSSSGKGRIGQIIQESVFGMELDSAQEADFPNIKTELKVTGYRWVNQDKLVSAKERLVITMIDYFEDIKYEFFDSNLFHKIENILLMLYEFRIDTPESDFVISKVFLMEFEALSETDKIIIIQDWNYILEKIRSGKAHELSEGDTMYLGACPKGANRNSVIEINGISTMKRAYAFKNSYMTYVLRSKVFNSYSNREELIKDLNSVKENGIHKYIEELFLPYIGKTLTEIDDSLNIKIDRDAKNYLNSYVIRMLRLQGKNLDDVAEFDKANIKIKTIRIDKKGKNKESVSFPVIDFIELSNETWEESKVSEYFENTKILFIAFDEVDDINKEYKLRKVKLWNMPLNDLQKHVKNVWYKTNKILNSELVVNVKKGRVYNNLPNLKDNPVAHLRPHAKDSFDTAPLPENCKIVVASNDGSKNIDYIITENRLTKHSFWLKKSYVLKTLNSD